MKKYLILLLLTCPLIAQSPPKSTSEINKLQVEVAQLKQENLQKDILIAQLKIQLAQFLGQQGQQELAAAQAKLQPQGVKNDQSITTAPEHPQQAKP